MTRDLQPLVRFAVPGLPRGLAAGLGLRGLPRLRDNSKRLALHGSRSNSESPKSRAYSLRVHIPVVRP